MAASLVVLDVGCNNGYGTKILSTRCQRVVGVDVSENAIESARKANANTKKIEFQVINGKTLPFDDQTFDLVTSFQVIEHVADVEPFLLEITRVLKAGGRAVFTTPNREIRLDPGMQPWNPFHVREYNAEALQETLARTFSEVKIEGLFADTELYAVEYDRVQKSKIAARRGRRIQYVYSLKNRLRTWLILGVKALLSEFLTRKIQEFVRGFERPKMGRDSVPATDAEFALKNFMEKWSLRNLYYDDENMADALDLIAVCTSGDQGKPIC